MLRKRDLSRENLAKSSNDARPQIDSFDPLFDRLPRQSRCIRECVSYFLLGKLDVRTYGRVHGALKSTMIDTDRELTCFEKTAMSSLKLSDEQTSPPATPGSRGVHVANSHFSNMSARSGNRGCLKQET